MNINDGAFFTSVKPYFKNVLNSIELPLSSIFYTSHPFLKKTYNSENFRRKSLLLTMEHFFSKFEITQWNGTFNCVCIVFFFHYFKYYDQNIFSRMVLYLKLLSAIFYQIFIFSPNDSPSKFVNNVFHFI